jgi:hypothetical protein
MNDSPASGQRRGSSGFIRPELYAKHKAYKGDVCYKTTGYSLAEYADNVESMVKSGDYRLFYKHFYYADVNGVLQFKTKGADDEYIINKKEFLEEE